MLFLLSTLSLFLTGDPYSSSPPKTNLKVDIHNVAQKKGAVYVALFRSGKDFPTGKPTEGKKIDATHSQLQTTFSVEPGDYAIAIFHDENGNGKMDKKLFGIPKEPYGFSNNFRPKMSAPKFSDCQFSVDHDEKKISITLNGF